MNQPFFGDDFFSLDFPTAAVALPASAEEVAGFSGALVEAGAAESLLAELLYPSLR
ncbi:MAG: hypothetical protein NT164_00465 [Verrucomicrobiae bacterium]|nr:hypothetical protein [Verrucomicrobiae bacterium]